MSLDLFNILPRRNFVTPPSPGNTDYRAGTLISIPAGDYRVDFSSELPDGNYFLQIQCTANESTIAYVIISHDYRGFNIEPLEECTLSYLAIPVK